MIVEGTYRFAGPPEAVWDLLLDPQVLVKALPGTRRLERIAEDRYEGLMQVGIGPITAAEFQVTVTIRDKEPPTRYDMDVDGKGRFGFTRGTAHVELAPEDGGTAMQYRADLQVGGKIAGVGQRLLDSVSRMMTKQGLEALNRELERRLQRGGEP